ncbi:endo-beta-N-acetylglucosaminidase [Gemella sp. oral taxon 928]|uniref:glucosaminidase domain-containing protein n=1 Tax=unclassified Gemella TaxID=2624949 RepID=UPI000768332A|nr:MULTISPECIES: glucosaminidase domain-containing protein [unclassified Gemella]AME08903.1 endo-beta-N-acetylglucosaminidase [Gemella sp. oral taxon 928]AXI26475.1 endo-beta-N-acetylglucosaminidase [Gemella sp. ND 6198]
MNSKSVKSGLMFLTVLTTPIVINEVVGMEAHAAAQGWVQQHGTWSYYYNGAQVKNKWVGDYYLGSNGYMVKNTWIQGKYYVDNNGKWVANAQKGWVKRGATWYYYNQNNTLARNQWAGNYWLGSDGKMATNSWVDSGRYYVDNNGKWVANAQKGWVKRGATWYYYNQNNTLARNQWAGNYWLGSDGKMATNSWVDSGRYYVDNNGKWIANAQKGWVKRGTTWYYYNQNNTLARNQWVGNYWLGSDGKMATNGWVDSGRYYVDNNGKWVANAGKSNKTYSGNTYSGYYKVKGLYIPVYDASGKILSHVSQGTVLFRDSRATSNGRIPVQVAGLTGYVNPSQVQAVTENTTFIPDYVSDGKYVYHRYSRYSKVKVAYHNPNMVVGKAYYSADGVNFGTFKLEHPFQFNNLKSKTNYSAADLNRLYNLMGASNSMLAGRGATFKEAERRYGVNALYLVAHSALESAWGKSNIAKRKNNFFGIAAYDSNPFNSAKRFDNVDAGILGAARWISEKYLTNGRYPAHGAYLGNKAGGMNVNYATAPYWGESIASIMFEANERLGRKDK